jgi:hypothetical protein
MNEKYESVIIEIDKLVETNKKDKKEKFKERWKEAYT